MLLSRSSMPSVGFTKHTHLFDYDHPSGVIFMTLGLVISLAGNLIRSDKQCICTHDNEIFLSLPNYEHYERERGREIVWESLACSEPELVVMRVIRNYNESVWLAGVVALNMHEHWFLWYQLQVVPTFVTPLPLFPPWPPRLKKRGVSYSPCSARSPANVSPSNTACHSFCYCLFLFFFLYCNCKLCCCCCCWWWCCCCCYCCCCAVITAERNFDSD